MRSSSRRVKFLSEPNRLRILRILSRRESCVCELIEQLGYAAAVGLLSLKRLRDAGLVRPRRHAQWVYYSIDPIGWERFMRPIVQFCLHPGVASRKPPTARATAATRTYQHAVTVRAMASTEPGPSRRPSTVSFGPSLLC